MGSRRLSALALSASLAMAMVACGDDDEPVTAAGGGQASPTTTAPVPTTAAPKATVSTASSSLGTIFVGPDGKALYTWDRDTGGQSACTGNCATTWPPLVLPAGTSAPVAGTGVTQLTTVARPDDASKLQVVWNGKPLYYYAGDAAPGEVKGDGVGGTWHVAKQS